MLGAVITLNQEEKKYFTVEYVIENIIFHNASDSFYIFSMKKIHLQEDIEPLYGTTPIGKGYFEQEIREGDSFRSIAFYTETKQYGWQLFLSASFPIAPSNIRGVKRFFKRFIKGVGKETADAIIQMYGVDCIHKLKEDDTLILNVPGIGEKRAEKINAQLQKYGGIERLADYLFQHGIVNYMTVVKIYERMGENALQKIIGNPYVLCTEYAANMFSIADKIAFEQGEPFNNPVRYKCAIMLLLKQYTFSGGDSYVPFQKLRLNFFPFLTKQSQYPSPTQNEVGDATKSFTNAILELEKSGDINLIKTSDGENVVYLHSLYLCESYITNGIIELLQDDENVFPNANKLPQYIKEFEQVNGLQLDTLQIQAISHAVNHKCSIVTGGPGTGKTLTINGIIKIFEKMKPNARIVLAAPTGRASKRMTELCHKEAYTIHRLLGLTSNSEDVNIRELDFEQPCDVLIADEFSMADIFLAAKLITAAKKNKIWLVLVGDVDQLPSVGPGMVLRDLIESNCIPVTRLRTLFRQDEGSQIDLNAKKINAGLGCMDKGGLTFNQASSDFYFFKAENEIQYRTILLQAISDMVEKGYDTNNITILSPTRKGIAGVESLNPLIRDILNPAGPNKKEISINDTIFRIGDRVMQIMNDYDIVDEGIFNGEVGVITYLDNEEKKITVRYPDNSGRDLDVTYDSSTYTEFEHAYAMTIHKSQGSEMSIVFLPAIRFPNYNKNLLYTGITRAKRMVVLIGNEEDLDYTIHTEGAFTRTSNLKNRIRSKMPLLTSNDEQTN